MTVREATIIAGWAATIGGFFVALPVGYALIATGMFSLALALFVMRGD